MDISSLTDDELWDRMKALARNERAALCDFVEHLAEVDKRGLPIGRGFRSLFEYCVHCLGCSEPAAYRRIRGARAIRLFPPVSAPLRDGRLTLETLILLHPHLKDPDAAALVKQAYGLKVWQVQALLAARRPEAPRRDVIRLCAPTPSLDAAVSRPDESLLAFIASAAAPAAVMPAAATPAAVPAPEKKPERRFSVRVAFTADAEFHRFLLRARQLLRHKYPDGRLEGVLKDALVALLERRDLGFRWGAGVRRV